MNTCQHPDCAREHDNASYCSRIHQRLDVLGIPLPEEDPCQECGGAWAQDGGLCEDCSTDIPETASSPDAPDLPPEGERVAFEQKDDGSASAYSITKGRITNEQELLEAVDADLEEWRVKSKRLNKWDLGYKRKDSTPGHYPLFQVRVNLEPRQDLVDSRAIIEEALEEMRERAPAAPDTPRLSDGDRDIMGEIMMPDSHIRMLAYAPETREAHYDSEIAARLFVAALKDNMERAIRLAGSVDRWLFPIGNDLAHADKIVGDSSGAATASGTVVDVDTRRKKSYGIIRSVLEAGILFLRETAPVEVVVIPGNHAPDTEFTLGELLDARFHNDSLVNIRNPESERDYIRHGRVLLGFTHGDDIAKSRLPMLMPIEEREKWAKTDHREWHMGHTHHLDQRGFAMEAEEDMTIRLRRCPTLAPADAWHAGRGFKHVRAAETYLWSKKYGFEGLVNCTPVRVEDLPDLDEAA